MPTRILHVVDSWAMGGLQNGVANLIDRMDSRHFENVICALRPVEEANAHRVPAGARVICLSREESGRRLQAPALARKIRAVKPDIVHTRNWGAFEALISAWAVGGCARIHSEHGIDWDSTTKEPLRRILCRRLAFHLAQRVLSVSQELKAIHVKRTGFPEHKIEVVHNGVDTRRFAPNQEARTRVRQELGIAPDEFCIGCVGNLIPVKDHLTLLRAVDGLGGRRWRLLIAGAGPELAALTAFIKVHPACKDRVHFLGRSNAIPELLNGLDTYVSSSLTEGISNSLLEAMASGVPALATATGGNPEVIVDRKSGWLFPVGDAARLRAQLSTLQVNLEQRRQLSQGALSRIRSEFSIDSMVRKYEEVYESLEPAAASPDGAVTRV